MTGRPASLKAVQSKKVTDEREKKLGSLLKERDDLRRRQKSEMDIVDRKVYLFLSFCHPVSFSYIIFSSLILARFYRNHTVFLR